MDAVGPYRLEGVVGSGGMGTVFRARVRQTGAVVAVKRIGVERCSERARARFRREAETAMSLRHDNIVRVVGFGETQDGGLYLAMEMLEGEDVATRLERGPLDLPTAVHVGCSAAMGLGVAHEAGIIHRDIKPANLFLCRDGTVKVLDFGLAITMGDASLGRVTETGLFVGTPAYMAVEQIVGLHTEDVRTDVWGLGATLYRAVAGIQPFDGPTPMTQLFQVVHGEPSPLPAHVPPALAAAILRALRKDKSERWQAMATFEAALRATLREATAAPPPPVDTMRVLVREEITLNDERPPSSAALGDEIRVVSVLLAEELTDLAAFEAAVEAELGSTVSILKDSAIGVFGGEAWRGDEAERAVRAGLQVRDAQAAFLLGVGTGRAKLLEAGAVGGAAVASAESTLSAAGVGADEETLRRVRGGFVTHGRAIVGRRPGGRVLGVRGIAGADAPLLGREREIALLAGLVRDVFHHGRAGGVLIVGPFGIGKGRLRHALELRVLESAADVALLVGRAEAQRSLQGWHPLAEAIRGALDLPDGAPPERLREHLQAGATGESVEFLGEILGADFPTTPQLAAARSDPALMAARVAGAIADFFERLARARPVLLMLDDLQWADPATFETIELLLARLANLPFAIVGVSRAALSHELPSPQRLQLEPLGPDVIRTLLRGLLGDAPVTEAIVERCGGNPRFAEELALAAAQGGLSELPVSVEAAVRARVDLLPRVERDLLRRASVLGRCFWAEGLAALGQEDAEAGLLRLRRRELVVPEPRSELARADEWSFSHPLLQEVLYESLTPEQRVGLHAAAGRWLAQLPNAPPYEVARHLDAGDLAAEAAPFWVLAAERAAREGNVAKALAASARALPQASRDEKIRLLLRRIDLLWYLGRDQAADLDALAALVREPWEEVLLLRRRAMFLRRRGLYAEALEPIRRAVELAPHDAYTKALELQILVESGTARPGAAAALVPEARAIEDPMTRAQALSAIAMSLQLQGDFAGFLPLAADAERVFVEAGHTQRAAAVRSDVGYALLQLGRSAEAVHALRDAEQACREAGNRISQGYALHNLGLALARTGDLAGGLAAERAAAEIAQDASVPRLALGCELYEALMLIEHGNPGAALPRLDAAQARPRAQKGNLEATAFGLRAAALVALGRLEDARAAAVRGLEERSTMGVMEDGEAELFLAAHEAGVPNMLAAGAALVTAAAERVSNLDMRRTYVEGVPARARLIARARDARLLA